MRRITVGRPHLTSTCSFSVTGRLLGLEQIDDIPTSTSRVPRGPHRGPGKRQTSQAEAEEFRFIKKWQLQMKDQWDDLEPFKGLPRPKKQFGNEAAEIVWPYALLMQRVVKIHPFTKSIYVYYPYKQQTEDGKFAVAVTRKFSRAWLIPITFHNTQVYVETELLVEYGETPWIVIHCLDGSHRVVPVERRELPTDEAEAVDVVLNKVLAVAEEMGRNVPNPKEATLALNERPLQQQYLRINYQWFGDTAEERMSHLVAWNLNPETLVPPKVANMRYNGLRMLNADGNLPNHNMVRVNARRDAQRMRTGPSTTGKASFLNSPNRASSKHSRFGGNSGTTK
jgi:hypothetical protein